MQVNVATNVFMYFPQERFAYVEEPFFVATDFPWQHGPVNWGEDSSHFVSDYDLQAIYPAPMFVPHHQCKDPNTGTLTAFWKYRRVAPPTPLWGSYVQLTDNAQMDTGNPPLGKYGRFANSL